MIAKWKTYDGRIVEMETIDHQHLSNIHHYCGLVVPELYDNIIRQDIMNVLNERFEGKILPYHPDPRFIREKLYLLKKGYLRMDDTIVINGTVVGWYLNNN
jgi:hypothetical protein